MLSILVHAQSVRWLFPAAAMLSAAPIHITVWTAVRLLTLPLPRRVYRALDDSLYSTYQRYVLFFMRCYTGAEVINFSRKGKNVLKNLINVLNDTVFLASLYFSGIFLHDLTNDQHCHSVYYITMQRISFCFNSKTYSSIEYSARCIYLQV